MSYQYVKIPFILVLHNSAVVKIKKTKLVAVPKEPGTELCASYQVSPGLQQARQESGDSPAVTESRPGAAVHSQQTVLL